MQRTGSSSRTTPTGGMPLKRLALGFGIGGVLVLVTLAGKLYLNPATKPAAKPSVENPAPPAAAAEATGISLPSLMDGLEGALEADSAQPAPLRKPAASSTKALASEDTTSPLELAVTLMVTIAAIVGVIWVIARLLRSTRLAPGNHRVLHMVDSLPLGAKRHVWVVGFRDRTLILGGGGEEVRLLAEYSDDEWAEQAETIEADSAIAISAASPQPTSNQAFKIAAETVAAPASAPRRSAQNPDLSDEEPAVTFELSAQAKAKAARAQSKSASSPAKSGKEGKSAKKRLPPGAHRVPAAFRHLLEEPGLMDESAS